MKPPKLYPRGPKGIFHVRTWTAEGTRTWKSTHTADRAEAEEIARRLMREHEARSALDAELIAAILPNETARAVFAKYIGRFPDTRTFLANAATAKLKQAAQNNPNFSRRLTEAEKAWADVKA